MYAMREPSGDQAGDSSHHAMYDLAISRGIAPIKSITYRPSSIRAKTTCVPSGENEASPLRPSLVSRVCEPSAFMTQRSCLVSAPVPLCSSRSRRFPSSDQAIDVRPFDGPREIRFAEWLGSTAQICDPSLYVISPCTRPNRSDCRVVPEPQKCGVCAVSPGVWELGGDVVVEPIVPGGFAH